MTQTCSPLFVSAASWDAARLSGPSSSRSFRTTALLAVIFVLNAFDLAFTNVQIERGDFAEANVLAAGAVAQGPAGAATYKALLLGAGVFIFYRCRRHWTAEAGAWILATCHAALMLWWILYLDTVEVCIQDPFTSSPSMPF